MQVYKHDPEKGEGQYGIEDGQVFSVVGATVKALHTPGHTRDHIVFLMEEEEAMFTGDSEYSCPLLYNYVADLSV